MNITNSTSKDLTEPNIITTVLTVLGPLLAIGGACLLTGIFTCLYKFPTYWPLRTNQEGGNQEAEPSVRWHGRMITRH